MPQHTTAQPEQTETLTMYSTSWCGYCKVLKRGLDQAGIEYVEIDIEEDADAANQVRLANRGNETVPTVLFPDGTTMTNPRISHVKAKLETLQ